MHCPLCLDAPLEPHFVGSTEVDMCTRCRGLWLDRGELDRLLADDGPSRSAPGTRSTGHGVPEPLPTAQAPASPKGSKKQKKPNKAKSKAQRLADLFEEVLDF